MFSIISKRFLNVLFIIFFVLLIDALADTKAINRGILGIKLGMTLDEVKKLFHIEEKEDGMVILMRRYGFDDPEKQTKINKSLDKKVFNVKDGLSEGVESIELFSRKNIIYQIALHYGKEYVQKIDWDLFTLSSIEKYGQPKVINNLMTIVSFTYHWQDTQTRLEVSKSGSLSDDKNKFIPTIYNVFYTDIKAYDIMKEEEKHETERTTIVPKF